MLNIKGTDPEDRRGAVLVLMEALTRYLDDLGVKPSDPERIPLMLGYATEFLGILLATIPAKSETARQEATAFTIQRLTTVIGDHIEPFKAYKRQEREQNGESTV